MRLRLRTLTLRIDWLMLLFPFTALMLGGGLSVLLLVLSLVVHEFSHWAAARVLHISMSSIRLTPFGGMAKIENPYGASTASMCAVSIAGPLSNLMLLLIASALCHWFPTEVSTWLELISINLILMIFNLFPALPLDGGRILYALLSRRIPETTALNLCLWTGRALSAGLIALAFWGVITLHRLNLSLLFAAAFILASGSDERRALEDCRMRTLMNALRPITKPTPADLIAIDAQMRPETALRAVRPGRTTLFAVYKNSKLHEIIDDRTLIDRILAQSTPDS